MQFPASQRRHACLVAPVIMCHDMPVGTPLRSQNGNFANTWTQAAGTLRAASGMQTEAI